ncbi:hypothetical protein MVES_000755 [Malassezia vespertilionis]|uniref:Asparagine synthetase domain-containing protein n=2 Tax=Malassezia vespertilionis TaxID=2020962 RepID=A0A2N1JEK5_9BASI|nr:hypothetical protein MVES_000755 [Malassezia vespertilionis]
MRGPDACAQEEHRLEDKHVRIGASVLGLCGSSVALQPMHASAAPHLVFLWSGEIFSTLDGDFDREKNDGTWIFAQIVQRVAAGNVCSAIVQTLAGVEGPYAYILLDLAAQCVYYGRDPLGRRSLLLHLSDVVCLASAVCMDTEDIVFEEVPCSTLWQLSVRGDNVPKPCPRDSPFATRLLLHESLVQKPAQIDAPLDALRAVLEASISERVTHIRTADGQTLASAHVAVLFSGGLDCTVLAALATQYINSSQPIDLINVAFENPRAHAAACERTKDSTAAVYAADRYAVPDRQTARKSVAELRNIYPSRRWNLVEVNVSYATYLSHIQTIQRLLHPNDSVMDLSIGAALLFAARGAGFVDGVPYTTPARVLLSGLGADELLAGYARHRHAFERRGDDALRAELQLDLDRLPTRNLGRDDRIIGAQGREARYPYLARRVLALLCALPISTKADFRTHAKGLGDKSLLRELALTLGMHHAAYLPKRAIQFGARSAKLDAQAARQKGNTKLALP